MAYVTRRLDGKGSSEAKDQMEKNPRIARLLQGHASVGVWVARGQEARRVSNQLSPINSAEFFLATGKYTSK